MVHDDDAILLYYNGIWHLWQILFKVVYPTVCRFTAWPADVFCNWWIKHTNNGCLRKCVHLPGNLNFGGYHDIYNLSRNSMVHTIIDWSFLFISEIFKCYVLNIYLARSFIHNLSFSNSCWLFVWYFRTSVRYFIILTFNNCFLLCIYMKHCFIMTLNFLNFYFMCENPFFYWNFYVSTTPFDVFFSWFVHHFHLLRWKAKLLAGNCCHCFPLQQDVCK